MAVVKLCCEDCMKPKKGRFQKVLTLENSCLSIYNYKNPYLTTDEEGTIIVHNASDNDLPNTTLLDDLYHYKILCSQCKDKVTRVRDILRQIPILKRNEVIGICDHCKTAKHLCCSRCKSITQSFLATKLREYKQRQYLLEQWIGKIQELLLLLLNGQIPCQRKACALTKSFIEMQKLLETPFTARELAIDTFPFNFDTTEMTPEKIIQKMTKHVYSGAKGEVADLKSIKNTHQIILSEGKKSQALQKKELLKVKECINVSKDIKNTTENNNIVIKGKRRKNEGSAMKKGKKGRNNMNHYKMLRVVKFPDKNRAFHHINHRLEDIHSDHFIKVSKPLNKKVKQVRADKNHYARSEISFAATPRFKENDDNKESSMLTMDNSKVSPRNKLIHAQNMKTRVRSSQTDKNRTMLSGVLGKKKRKTDNEKLKNITMSYNADSAVGSGNNMKIHNKEHPEKLESENSKYDARIKGENADGFEIIFDRQIRRRTERKRSLYSEDKGRKRHKTTDWTPLGLKENKKKGDLVSEAYNRVVEMCPNDKAQFDNIIKQSGFQKQVAQKRKSARLYSSPNLMSSKKNYSIDTLRCKMPQQLCTKCIRGTVVLPNNTRQCISATETTPGQPLVYKNNYIFEPDPLSNKLNKNVETDAIEDDLENTSHKGITSYQLSDQRFIKNGWTQLPIQKSFRRLCVYRMVPTDVAYDWFLRHKGKVLFYNTGEVLAEVDNFGSGRWLYKNGRVALHFEKHEEAFGLYGKFIIYSDGDAHSYLEKPSPVTVLATFDYLGNGTVYSEDGHVRLEYNQYKGRTLDPDLGPPGKWQWNVGNDNEHSVHEVQLCEQYQHDSGVQNLMLQHEPPIEENVFQDQEELTRHLECKKFCQGTPSSSMLMPLQIRRLKCCKINKYLTLRVIDQQHIYVNFRHGISNLKVNIGMKIVPNDVLGIVLADHNDITNLYVQPAKSGSTVSLSHTDIGKNKARKR